MYTLPSGSVRGGKVEEERFFPRSQGSRDEEDLNMSILLAWHKDYFFWLVKEHIWHDFGTSYTENEIQ